MKRALLFWRDDYGQTVEDADELKVTQIGDSDDLQWAAEQYAEFYHGNRDGWEAQWPIEFNVADEDKKFMGKVSVDREARPHFCGQVCTPTDGDEKATEAREVKSP